MLKSVFCAIALTVAVTTLAPPANADSDRTVNANFGAIGALVGLAHFGVDIALNESWTIGPEAYYWRRYSERTYGFSDMESTTWSVGVRANWFKNGRYTDGLYLGPSVQYQSFEVKSDNDLGERLSKKSMSPIVGWVVGYAWFWDRFNITLGAGTQLGFNDNELVLVDSRGLDRKSSNVFRSPMLEFDLGWTF